jgi:hypothetical protein
MPDNRVEALRLAVQLHEPSPLRVSVDKHHADELVRRVLHTAERFEHWLDRPRPVASLHIRIGQVVNQATGQPTGTTIPEGAHTMQLHDDEQVTLTIQAKDAKGYDVADSGLTWSVDDDTVASIEVSDDGESCTILAGAPGSTVVTVTDGAAITATKAVDVVPGGVATIVIAEGDVTKQ